MSLLLRVVCRVCCRCRSIFVVSLSSPLDLPGESVTVASVVVRAARTEGCFMSKILNTSQQIVTGVTYPRSAYSRVIGCKLNWMAPVAWYGIWTVPIGQAFYLLGVDVWLYMCGPNGTMYHRIDLRTGFGSPTTGDELEGWDRLAGLYDGTELGDIELYGTEAHVHLNMSMHFDGNNRRFGVRTYVGSGTHSVVNAAFQISEG